MTQRHRLRRVIKWAGLVGCLLLALALVLSAWWSFSMQVGNYFGFVQWGGIAFGYSDKLNEFDSGLRRNSREGLSNLWFRTNSKGPLRIQRWGGSSWSVTPLWFPLAIIAVPTIWAWRRDRRFPPGHCQECGYDLTGIASGVCPECPTRKVLTYVFTSCLAAGFLATGIMIAANYMGARSLGIVSLPGFFAILTVGLLGTAVWNPAWWIVCSMGNAICYAVIATPIALRATRRYRRFPQGSRKQDFEPSCRECGYNLTANVSGVCPECGTEIKPR